MIMISKENGLYVERSYIVFLIIYGIKDNHE